MDEFIEAATTRVIEWIKDGFEPATAVHTELKIIAKVARRELARELLDDIKYSTEDMEDSDIVGMIIQSLAAIEDGE